MKMEEFDPKMLSGRNRRLLFEWQKLEQGLVDCSDISWSVLGTNAVGLPASYRIDYHIHSICGVTDVERLNNHGVINAPLFADHFLMQIDLPEKFPCVDGAPNFRFLTKDGDGNPIPHPWHPNIRWFGEFAGRVCINLADTFTDLLWGVRRVADYLRYISYHAVLEPPFPEDLQVAAWVIRQGEPNGWIFFNQDGQNNIKNAY